MLLSFWLLSLNKPKQFPGWRMVLVAFSVDFFAVGFFFYSYGAFFNAIAMILKSVLLAHPWFLPAFMALALFAPLVGRALTYPQ